MSLYHVNRKGEVRQCRAKLGNCPLGEPAEHYGTREAAQEGYEKLQEAATVPEGASKKRGWLAGHYDGERDVVDGRPGSWNTSVRTGLGAGAKPTFYPDDIGQQDSGAKLPDSFGDESWREVQRPTLDGGRFAGMAQAQREALEAYNNEQHGDAKYMAFDGPIGDYTEEFAARLLRGEKSAYDYELRNRNFKIMSTKELAFSQMTDERSGAVQPIDLMLAFPDRDLVPVLDRLGVNHVTVSPLKNSREVGLVYTVITPMGSTRSFSIYEHRNTDSVIINGQENWDPEEKPYGPYSVDAEGRDSKNNFFAEFSTHAPTRQVAESLGYLLKAAQEGELESDQELIAKADHLDWGAILSEQIPGFGEWLSKKKNDHYSSQEFLDRSFEAWENSF